MIRAEKLSAGTCRWRGFVCMLLALLFWRGHDRFVAWSLFVLGALYLVEAVLSWWEKRLDAALAREQKRELELRRTSSEEDK